MHKTDFMVSSLLSHVSSKRTKENHFSILLAGFLEDLQILRCKLHIPRSKVMIQMALSRSGEDKSDSMVSSLLRLCLPRLLSSDSSFSVDAPCTWKWNRSGLFFQVQKDCYQYLWYGALKRTVPLSRSLWPENFIIFREIWFHLETGRKLKLKHGAIFLL